MTVSVIVPNYNGIAILRKCLVSLLEHDRKPDQIVVVDNGSSDGSPQMIRREFPEVTLIALETNTGFTGANNSGLKASTGDMIVLLNNDCIVEPNWLRSLLQRMVDPEVAAVTSSMRNIDDVNVMDSAGGEIDWMCFSKDIGKGKPASLFRKSMNLPFPCGGAVMIRRDALPDREKLFWDVLFIYQEDLDLGFELIRTGWKVVYEPEAVVRHMHSATTGNGSFFKENLCIRNRLLVMRKHFDRETFSRMLPIIRKWHLLWLLASLARGRFTLAKSIWKGTKDGLSIPVEPFAASVPINEVFLEFAIKNESAKMTKKKMYLQIEKIIKEEMAEYSE